MIQSVLKPIYHWSHDFLNRTAGKSPLIPRKYHGYLVGRGHISDEHLEQPALDDALGREFEEIGISVLPYHIDPSGYDTWIKEGKYPESYYGGGNDPEQNFTEKTLEHYVSAQFFDLKESSVFIDIAACTSPFSRILAEKHSATTYQQDLIYPKGVDDQKIGGWAHELHLPDNSVDAVTLHCSLEHFEGDSDTLFFQELERVLKPGGRAVILPFYIAHTYTIHVDPAFNLLKFHRPKLDPKARLRYCDWYQYFSRHYDVAALKRRVLDKAPHLTLTLHRVENFQEVYQDSYLRWIGVFQKEAF